MILVFGADGQVGRALRRVLPEAHGLTRAQADLTDDASVQAAIRDASPRLIVNAAAYTAVDRAESEPDLAYRINGHAPGVMARAAAACGAGMVQLSTDYVFDGRSERPYREDDAVAPLGVYGASKLAGEVAVRVSGARHWVIRTSWVVSADGHNFVKTIARAATTRDALSVVSDQFGCPTPAADLAQALAATVPDWMAGRIPEGVYHVTGQGETSWHGLACEVVTRAARWTGRHPPVHAIATADWPTPARRPARSTLCGDRWAEVTGRPMPDWRPGVAAIVDHLCQETR
jgi:dTDP-4-dehydrorhamnose reductase